MKKLALILANILILVGLGSCQDTPLIGDLAGQWQITKIEYPDGTVVERYYCFYRHTAQLTGGEVHTEHTANMTYDKPDITLEFPRAGGWQLTQWGIIATDTPGESTTWVQKYHIDTLNGSKLVMTTEQGVVIYCRKF